MHPTYQKFTEFFTLSLLRERFPGFPSGSIRASESPDFLVAITPRKRIGIELTRIVQLPALSIAYGGITIQEQFLEMIKNRVNVLWPGGVWIRLRFSAHYALTPENLLSNAIMGAAAIRRAAENLKRQITTLLLNSAQLPPALSAIWIGVLPDSQGEVWEVEQEPLPVKAFRDAIALRIARKEEKTTIYKQKRLHQLWLLLYAGTLPKVNINQISGIPIQSTKAWNRILLLELDKRRVYELTGNDWQI